MGIIFSCLEQDIRVVISVQLTQVSNWRTLFQRTSKLINTNEGTTLSGYIHLGVHSEGDTENGYNNFPTAPRQGINISHIHLRTLQCHVLERTAVVINPRTQQSEERQPTGRVLESITLLWFFSVNNLPNLEFFLVNLVKQIIFLSVSINVISFIVQAASNLTCSQWGYEINLFQGGFRYLVPKSLIRNEIAASHFVRGCYKIICTIFHTLKRVGCFHESSQQDNWQKIWIRNLATHK